MEREESTGPSQRRWTVFFAVVWAFMGAWSLSSGQTWLGVGQLVLAGALGLSLVSPRIDAFMGAPLFRRKRQHDAG